MNLTLSKCALKRANNFQIRHTAPLIKALLTIEDTKVLKSGPSNTLIAIAKFWNKEGNTYPSQTKLANMTGVDRRTINTHIKKLTQLECIKTTQRTAIDKNGNKYNTSLNYHFVPHKIGLLFEQAKSVLRKKALKKTAKKISPPPPSNDLTISSPKGSHVKDLNITVSKQVARQGFLETKIKALQDELSHLTKLKIKTAYESVKLKAQILKGEVFSKAEIAIRAAKAARVKAFNEKTEASRRDTADRLKTLDTAAMKNHLYKKGLTEQQATELRKLVDQHHTISIGALQGLKYFESQFFA